MMPGGRMLRSPISNPIGHLGGGGSVGVRPTLGSFHKGGVVEKDGAYDLKKGETVIPPPQGKRDSEYRRVFLSRKKKDGGDSTK